MKQTFQANFWTLRQRLTNGALIQYSLEAIQCFDIGYGNLNISRLRQDFWDFQECQARLNSKIISCLMSEINFIFNIKNIEYFCSLHLLGMFVSHEIYNVKWQYFVILHAVKKTQFWYFPTVKITGLIFPYCENNSFDISLLWK